MLATVAPALAQGADALKKAQVAFDQAQRDYLQGKFDEAAKGFQEAYAARPFPQFLYNVGASYHMKGKKASDVGGVHEGGRVLQALPRPRSRHAADKAKVEKAIGVLEAEIKRLSTTPAPATGAGSGSAAHARSRRKSSSSATSRSAASS